MEHKHKHAGAALDRKAYWDERYVDLYSSGSPKDDSDKMFDWYLLTYSMLRPFFWRFFGHLSPKPASYVAGATTVNREIVSTKSKGRRGKTKRNDAKAPLMEPELIPAPLGQNMYPHVFASLGFIVTSLRYEPSEPRTGVGLVLEFGCGNSPLAEDMLKDHLCGEIKCIDYSELVIEQRVKQTAKVLSTSLSFEAMDCREMTFPSEHFAGVFDKATFDCIDCTGVQSDVDQTIAEIYRHVIELAAKIAVFML